MILYTHTVMVIQSHPSIYHAPCPSGISPPWLDWWTSACRQVFHPRRGHACPKGGVDAIARLHPQSTFMSGFAAPRWRCGIFDGDIVQSTRLWSLNTTTSWCHRGQRIHLQTAVQARDRIRLMAANPAYPDIRPKEGQTIEVWGVVVDP